MERRNFIKAGCNACLAFGSGIIVNSLASCSPKLSVIKTEQHNMKFSIPESDMAASDGRLIGITNFDYDVFLKKNPDKTYTALAMICTHAGHSLVKTGNTFYCSLHGSEFDISGNVLKGPADRNLIHLPVSNNNGKLEVTLVDATTI